MQDPLFETGFGSENGTAYRLSLAFAKAFAGKAIVEGLKDSFDVEEFAGAGKCKLRTRPTPHALVETSWRRAHGLSHSASIAVSDVEWEGQALVVGCASWPEGYNRSSSNWVIAEDRAVAERFAVAVCAYCNDPHDAILCFRGGCWTKSGELWKQVQSASFDDLVLASGLGEEIRGDFGAFLAAKDDYARYGVPWKRGVLFVGPPGNGKTHCLRATIRMLDVPCLYVQSLKSKYETDDANIGRVFDRAREVSPCCLVFEDLDAMITPDNRSFFLNQLDGFASSSGLLTLATTNHPDRLDPAIVERPSRFDRKYHFVMPARIERARYAEAWNARLEEGMRMGATDLERLVDETDGFSFAYLKELFVSAMMRWMKDRAPGGMLGLMQAQLATLRAQMTTELTAPAKPIAAIASTFGDDD